MAILHQGSQRLIHVGAFSHSAFTSFSLLHSTKSDIYPVFGTASKNGSKTIDPVNKRVIALVYIYSCPSIGFFH